MTMTLSRIVLELHTGSGEDALESVPGSSRHDSELEEQPEVSIGGSPMLAAQRTVPMQ